VHRVTLSPWVHGIALLPGVHGTTRCASHYPCIRSALNDVGSVPLATEFFSLFHLGCLPSLSHMGFMTSSRVHGISLPHGMHGVIPHQACTASTAFSQPPSASPYGIAHTPKCVLRPYCCCKVKRGSPSKGSVAVKMACVVYFACPFLLACSPKQVVSHKGKGTRGFSLGQIVFPMHVKGRLAEALAVRHHSSCTSSSMCLVTTSCNAFCFPLSFLH